MDRNDRTKWGLGSRSIESMRAEAALIILTMPPKEGQTLVQVFALEKRLIGLERRIATAERYLARVAERGRKT